MESGYIGVKDDQVELGKFRKIVEPHQRSPREGRIRLFWWVAESLGYAGTEVQAIKSGFVQQAGECGVEFHRVD